MRFMYHMLRNVLFRIDPERIHNNAIRLGEILGKSSGMQRVLSTIYGFEHPMLEQNICGLHFKNPVGLAGGFDKDGRLTQVIPAIGFGHMEVGSVTAEPCSGNPKPRLYRLPKDKSIIVNYGLKSEGADMIASRMRKISNSIPTGINVAFTNKRHRNIDSMIADYRYTIKKFSDVGDYYTINISCPNAYAGQIFHEPKNYARLLKNLSDDKILKPCFVKLKPEANNVMEELIDISRRYGFIKGFVLTNLMKDRKGMKIKTSGVERIKGGISGRPLASKSVKMLKEASAYGGRRFIYISVGGIFSGADAYQRILRGASLVQLITGMIYEGPGIAMNINREIVRLLRANGFDTLTDAVGEML